MTWTRVAADTLVAVWIHHPPTSLMSRGADDGLLAAFPMARPEQNDTSLAGLAAVAVSAVPASLRLSRQLLLVAAKEAFRLAELQLHCHGGSRKSFRHFSVATADSESPLLIKPL